MAIVLGHRPTKAELLLRYGCDFTWTLELDGELLDEEPTVTLYVYERDSDEILAFWPALWVPGEFVAQKVIPGDAIPAHVTPDKVQLQIYADDHALIPHGARFSVTIEKPGFPKTPWLEGRVSKANR